MNNMPKKADAWVKKSMQLKEFYEEYSGKLLFDYITPAILHEMYTETEDLYGYTVTEFVEDVEGILKKQIKDFEEQSAEKDFKCFLQERLVRFPKIFEFLVEFFDFSKLENG